MTKKEMKEKYPHLMEARDRLVESRLSWLEGAIRAGILCEFLPEEIKTLHITSMAVIGEELSLTIEAEAGTVKTLKTLGIQGLSPKVSSWSKKHFWTTGEGKLSNGVPLHINVANIEEPEGCVVKEKTTTSKEFVLVCPQTGEEIE